MAKMESFGVDPKHQFDKDLYEALSRREKDEVVALCRRTAEGPLHVVTVHGDTVLHMAAYSKQKDLLIQLLKMVPSDKYDKLTHQNDMGDTILHEVATAGRLVEAASEVLRIAPASLLGMKNLKGETAIFRASRYGKRKMFRSLDEEFRRRNPTWGEQIEEFQRRDDKATVLHMSVVAEHFDLALEIAKRYEYLVYERDGDWMTPLQLLSCKPSAFYLSSKHGSIKRFIYACISTEVRTTEPGASTCCRIPLWESLRRQKQRYEVALELAKFLIEKDTSWENTESRLNIRDPRTHRYGMEVNQEKAPEEEEAGKTFETQKTTATDIAETPLILATKSGCVEIVEEILRVYPQAIEHVDDEGRNILHVAIKYRQIEILDMVEKLEVPMRRLVRKIDDKGNSILHMVGIKTDHQLEDLRNPALVLQESLLLFERVKTKCTSDFVKLINSDQQTAEQLFATNNSKIHGEAKEWLKRTVENCSIVAVLIATVAFAAAYTVPGGSNDKTGYPILLNRPFFIIFTVADVLSITFALTSVVTFLSILTSPFQLTDFKRSLPQALMLGVTLLILSVTMMMLAFAATIILIIAEKGEWTKIALYSMAFLPVCIFVLSYFPLYLSLWKTFKESLKVLCMAFPRCKSDKATGATGGGYDPYEDEEADRYVGSSIAFATEDRGYSV